VEARSTGAPPAVVCLAQHRPPSLMFPDPRPRRTSGPAPTTARTLAGVGVAARWCRGT